MTEKQLKEIYDNYSPSMIQRACKRLSTQDAEDVVIKVFLKMWDLQPTFECQGQILKYLTVAVDRTAMNVKRDNKRDKNKLEEISYYEQGEYEKTLDVWEREAEWALLENRLMKLLLSSVDKMSGVKKKVFELWLEGKEYKQIAQILDMNHDTVKSHVRHAKAEVLKLAARQHINTKI